MTADRFPRGADVAVTTRSRFASGRDVFEAMGPILSRQVRYVGSHSGRIYLEVPERLLDDLAALEPVFKHRLRERGRVLLDLILRPYP